MFEDVVRLGSGIIGAGWGGRYRCKMEGRLAIEFFAGMALTWI